MTKLLSVVIPIYNVEDYLEECVTSLYNQGLTINEFEVIAINDGSTDSSLSIIEKLSEVHDNIRIVNSENCGLSITRNKGIDFATGEFITFLDSDDTIPDYSYKRMLSYISTTGSDVVTGPVVRVEGTKIIRSGLHKRVGFLHAIKQSFDNQPELVYDTTSTNKMYRRKFLIENRIKFQEHVLFEDILFSQKVFLKAKGIDILDQPVYHWRIRQGENQSISQDRKNIKGYVDRINNLSLSLQAHRKLGSNSTISAFERRILDFDLPIYAMQFEEADKLFFDCFIKESKKIIAGLSKEQISESDYRMKILIELLEKGNYELLRDGFLSLSEVFNSSLNTLDLPMESKAYSHIQGVVFKKGIPIYPRVEKSIYKDGNIIIYGELKSEHISDLSEIMLLEGYATASKRNRLKKLPIKIIKKDKTFINFKLIIDMNSFNMDSPCLFEIVAKIKGSELTGILAHPLSKISDSTLFVREKDQVVRLVYDFGWRLVLYNNYVSSEIISHSVVNDFLVLKEKTRKNEDHEWYLSSNSGALIKGEMNENEERVFCLKNIPENCQFELQVMNRYGRSFEFSWLEKPPYFNEWKSDSDEGQAYFVRWYNKSESITLKKTPNSRCPSNIYFKRKKICISIEFSDVKPIELILKNDMEISKSISVKGTTRKNNYIVKIPMKLLKKNIEYKLYLNINGMYHQLLDIENKIKEWNSKFPDDLDLNSKDGKQLVIKANKNTR